MIKIHTDNTYKIRLTNYGRRDKCAQHANASGGHSQLDTLVPSRKTKLHPTLFSRLLLTSATLVLAIS